MTMIDILDTNNIDSRELIEQAARDAAGRFLRLNIDPNKYLPAYSDGEFGMMFKLAGFLPDAAIKFEHLEKLNEVVEIFLATFHEAFPASRELQ